MKNLSSGVYRIPHLRHEKHYSEKTGDVVKLTQKRYMRAIQIQVMAPVPIKHKAPIPHSNKTEHGQYLQNTADITLFAQ
jgi:hypothetical protein